MGGMWKYVSLVLLALFLAAASGCKTPPGSREYIPGKGWVPN
jgi:hypothetical protein